MPDPSKALDVFREIAILLRQAITANDGKVLVAADASQIEARILAYLAGETELHNAFAEGKDIYSIFAQDIFGVPVYKSKSDDNSPEAILAGALRQIGKQAILGLGFGMGTITFYNTLAGNPECQELFKKGLLSKKICRDIVDSYRTCYPAIVAFWKGCEDAFIKAAFGQNVRLGSLEFINDRISGVKIRLPSGRELIYPKVSVKKCMKTINYIDKDGNEAQCELESNDIRYGRNVGLYSGKIVENIVQAVARDVLVEAILRLEAGGYPVVIHIHDSIACSVDAARAAECQQALLDAWRKAPEWAPGLALDSEGFSGNNLFEIL